jgi:hypothetical protein
VDCRSCLEALNRFHGKPPALRGLSSQLKQMKKDKLVLRLITFGLLRRLLVDHFGSHAVAGLPNLVPSQAIVSRNKLTNRRSAQRLSLCFAPDGSFQKLEPKVIKVGDGI